VCGCARPTGLGGLVCSVEDQAFADGGAGLLAGPAQVNGNLVLAARLTTYPQQGEILVTGQCVQPFAKGPCLPVCAGGLWLIVTNLSMPSARELAGSVL
jgi:hypothetical protein